MQIVTSHEDVGATVSIISFLMFSYGLLACSCWVELKYAEILAVEGWVSE